MWPQIIVRCMETFRFLGLCGPAATGFLVYLLSCYNRLASWVQVRWFELPPMMIFHVANAWQKADVVKVFACCFEEVRARCLPAGPLQKSNAIQRAL